MENFARQIAALTQKVDLLVEHLEQVSNKVTILLSHVQQQGELERESGPGCHRGAYTLPALQSPDLSHKDVLVDYPNPEGGSYGADKLITPELQVQRLTAQLTAAYNRMAALEEQILARRVLP